MKGPFDPTEIVIHRLRTSDLEEKDERGLQEDEEKEKEEEREEKEGIRGGGGGGDKRRGGSFTLKEEKTLFTILGEITGFKYEMIFVFLEKIVYRVHYLPLVPSLICEELEPLEGKA